MPAETQVHNLYVTQTVNFNNQEKSRALDSLKLAIAFNIFIFLSCYVLMLHKISCIRVNQLLLQHQFGG
jgi:hypothetical protein